MSPKEALDSLRARKCLTQIQIPRWTDFAITHEEYEAITAYIKDLEEFTKSIINYSEQDQKVQAELWGNIIADAKENIK